MEELQDRLGQLVAGVFGELSMDDGRPPIWSAPADIEETDEAFHLVVCISDLLLQTARRPVVARKRCSS